LNIVYSPKEILAISSIPPPIDSYWKVSVQIISFPCEFKATENSLALMLLIP
jgi:hypothetical protein